MSYPSSPISNDSPLKKSTILVIGDHGSGKTTFLKRFCSEIPDKKLNKSSAKINIYIKRQFIERSCLSNTREDANSLKETIEFIEICGEKNYKDAMGFYVSQLLVYCSAIFYFFDLTNKKCLFNFYMWIKFLIEAWDYSKGENPLWECPFLILAGKRNLINDLDTMKLEIEDYFQGLFGCSAGENVLYLQRIPKKIDLNEVFLESFLKEVCIETLLKEEKFALDLQLMRCDLKKYCLQKDALLNNLLVNTIARETMANLYWQFINYLWGYYKSMKSLLYSSEKFKRETKKN